MPAVSQQQQKFMGIVRAIQKGDGRLTVEGTNPNHQKLYRDYTSGAKGSTECAQCSQ